MNDETGITADRIERIRTLLGNVEKEERIHVLYACESGSRAWGFPSTDSDYDVRFIYAHPVEWYLSVQTRRDVIERPLTDLIDLSGWDIGKALALLRKSNPPLLEWLQSPIVYVDNADFRRELTGLLPTYYSPRNCLHHYLYMAQGNIREYLSGDRVWVKKYFYVLRPLLACLWIEAGRGVVPMEFRALLDGVTLRADLRAAIERILADKLAGREMDDGPRVPVFHQFFDQEIPRLEGVVENIPLGPKPDNELLDRTFRYLIGWST